MSNTNEQAEISMSGLIEGQRKLNETMQQCLEAQRRMFQFMAEEQKRIIRELCNSLSEEICWY